MQHVTSIINSITLMSAIKEGVFNIILIRKLIGVAPQYFYYRLYQIPGALAHHITLPHSKYSV